MQIHELNTKALTNPAYVPFDDGTDTYKANFHDIIADAVEEAYAEADISEGVVNYTSGDSSSPTSWSSVSTLTSGLSLKTLFNRVSTMIKNVRYLYSRLGSSSISNVSSSVTGAIGNTSLGTTATSLSGAIAEHEGDISSLGGRLSTAESDISTLNGKISTLLYVQDYAAPQITISSGTPGTRGTQVQLDVTKSGYTPLLVRLTQVSDSSLANVVPFFGTPSSPNTVYVNAYRASGGSGTITANVRVVYLKS